METQSAGASAQLQPPMQAAVRTERLTFAQWLVCADGVDTTTGLSFAMDLTPLVLTPEIEIISFVQEHIQRFAHDVANRLTRLS